MHPVHGADASFRWKVVKVADDETNPIFSCLAYLAERNPGDEARSVILACLHTGRRRMMNSRVQWSFGLPIILGVESSRCPAGPRAQPPPAIAGPLRDHNSAGGRTASGSRGAACLAPPSAHLPRRCRALLVQQRVGTPTQMGVYSKSPVQAVAHC